MVPGTSHDAEGVPPFQIAPFHELFGCDAVISPPTTLRGVVEGGRDEIGGDADQGRQSPWDAELVIVLLETDVQHLIDKGDRGRVVRPHGLSQL